jgi:hypothetical protein
VFPIAGIVGAASAARSARLSSWYDVAGAFAAILTLVAFTLLVTCATVLLVTGDRRALVATLLLTPIVAPHPFIAHVLVPLGACRVAWALDRATGHVWHRRPDRGAAAALWGALALLRRPGESAASFVERDLSRQLELGSSGAAAAALVALSRGDVDTARAVFTAISENDGAVVYGQAGRLAREFLALEAASKGDWRRALIVATGAPRSRLTRWLAHAARRVVRPGPVDDVLLGPLWLIAPQRSATRAMARVARRSLDPVAAVGPDLRGHGVLMGRPRGSVRRVDLDAAVQSLDAFRRSPEVLASLGRRALVLDTGQRSLDPQRVLDRVVRDAEADLIAVCLDHRIPQHWLGSGITAESVRTAVRETRFARAKALVTELRRRARARVDLPEIEEWRAWGDACAACSDVVLGVHDAREYEALFRAIHDPLTSYCVRLCNVRSRRALAGAIFFYLRGLCDRAGANDVRDLVGRNVRACRADRLPTIDLDPADAIGDLAAVTRYRTGLGYAQMVAIACGLGVLIAAKGMDPMPWLGAIAGAIAAVVAVRGRFRRLVDLAWNVDGLVLQTPDGRHVLLPDDVVTVRPGRGAAIVVRLRRRPACVPRRVFTIARSPAEAAAAVSRLEGLLRSAAPGAPRSWATVPAPGGDRR